MSWLKRNLFLVVGSLIALGLLGVAGYYLYAQYQREAAISTQLAEASAQFEQLNQRKPTIIGDIGRSNIAAAKVEQKRLRELLDHQRELFSPVTSLTNIDSAEFKSLLETTIDGLQKLAERQGVRTPDRYSYTFKPQRESLVFDAKDLLPWTYQVLEIKALCQAVFEARVHSLASIRRDRATKKDIGSDILNRHPVTNTVASAVISTYEVVFHGFSPELAEVLDNLRRATNTFLVKNVNIQRASGITESAAETEAAPDPIAARYGVTPEAAQQRPQSAEQLMRSRYGIGPRGAAPRAPTPTLTPVYRQPAGAPVQSRRAETVLDEQLLKITLLVESVRLRELAQ
jgi:hypothetical protein